MTLDKGAGSGPRSAHWFGAACAGLALSVGCHDATATRQVELVRETTVQPGEWRLNADAMERFGLRSMSAPGRDAAEEPELPRFAWDTPAGWKELPTSSMRLANFQVAGHPGAECYLTMLGGVGGGLAANVNRWRTQMNLPPMSSEDIEALPKGELFGRPATRVDLRGSFTGMNSSEKLPDYRMIGLIVVEPGGSLFLKMVGPDAVVGSQGEALEALAKSFRLSQPGEAAAPDSPGAPQDTAAAPAANVADGLSWVLPAGWRRAPDRSMRLASFQVDEQGDVEASLTRLAGEGGGLLANVNRWRKQMSREDLTEQDLAQATRIPMLGGVGVLVEIESAADASSPALMLGALCVRPEGSVFVKLTGPRARIEAQREAFRAFSSSLSEAP